MHTLYYALAFSGLFAIFTLILALFWQLTNRLPFQRKSKSLLFTVAILLALYLMSAYIRPMWYELFDMLNLLQGDVGNRHFPSTDGHAPFTFEVDLNRSFTAGYIFVVAYLANTLIGYFLWNGVLLDPESGEPYVPKFLQQIVGGLIFAAAILASVALYYEKLFQGTLATLGASGAIGAFIAADPIKKAITAISLNINKPIKKGEFLRIDDMEGTVDSIGWRAIRLLTIDNCLLTIPTANFLASNYINYSRPDENRYISVPITMRTAISPARIRTLLAYCGEDSPLSSGKAEVQLVSMESVFSEYLVTVCANSYDLNQVRNDLFSSIWYMSRREGLLPYPKHYELSEDPIDYAVKLLNNVETLASLSEEDDIILAKKAEFAWYGYPERIVLEGEVETCIYIIAKGEVDVLVKQADGSNLKVGSMSKNSFFGEMGLLTGAPRTATIRAGRDVLLCKITKEALQPIIEKRPDVIERLSEVLAERETATLQANNLYSEEQKSKAQQGAKEKLLSLMSDFFKKDTGEDEVTEDKTKRGLF